jgi:hypothetical protein
VPPSTINRQAPGYVKMKIKFVGALDQLVVAVIVVGAIVLAIPIFIFGLIRVLWDELISWATPRKPIVAERIRRWAEATEAHIVGQSGKQTKIDSPR